MLASSSPLPSPFFFPSPHAGPAPASRRTGDSSKLQQHLDLLREQYVKLQQKHYDLEQKYSHAISTSGSVGPDHFVSRLLTLVADLYDKSLYRLDWVCVGLSCKEG